MKLFPVPHKSVYSHSDWANWASRPFCLLEERLVPRLSSYWKSHLPQGLMGCICALRRFLFSFVCGFSFAVERKLRQDKQNAHSRWRFSLFSRSLMFENNALCCSKVMLANTGKANREILSVTECGGKHLKNYSTRHKKSVTGNFPSHGGFLFSFFISVMSPPGLLLSP